MQKKLYIVSLKTVENSFTWCGYERYAYAIIMQNETFL